MCGICGFFGKKKNKREIVEKMKEKLVHRGPDAQGSFVNDSVALGFRRLSIIDLEGGLQPMKSSSQNLTVVFNGEIYNYQELREQMEREKKILFVTRSDTETLVNGLEAYGPAFVEQLRGMFAFAVWNEKKEELMLARDFFGIKPLFYTVVDGNFVFASEIKSILQFPGVPKKLNERALEQYLSFQYSVLEETFFEGIYRLPPGCMLFYRQGKYEICRYFQPKLQPEAGCSLADMEKKLESVLKKSVRRPMNGLRVSPVFSGGENVGAAIWSVMWKWELSCPAVWIRVLLPCCPGQKWRLRWDFWMGTAATTRKTGPGRWPGMRIFLITCILSGKRSSGMCFQR